MVTFDSAPQEFATWIAETIGSGAMEDGRLVRDIYGRLSFVTTEEAANRLAAQTGQPLPDLGAYAASHEIIVGLPSDELSAFLAEPSVAISGQGLRMIDRRVAGEEWLTRPAALAESPQRLVFHSVKGGVGRTTGLAITAAHLASRGFNTLVMDLDLEAPGIGSALLSSDEMPDYGVVDWFAALAAGADSDDLLQDMTSACPLTSPKAVVDVVPACGAKPGAYLSKLARAYMPGAAEKEYAGFSFARKTDLLIGKLCQRRPYDFVLIDARAGLHETSGSLLLGLGAKVLVFGTDGDQTFDDFAILFDALQDSFAPELGGADVRGAFKMVHAKAPRETGDRREFRERSWALWTSSLYDEDDHPEATERTAFTFDLSDEEAPHFPLAIIGDDSYSRFNPRTNTYQLDAEAYAPVFGSFLKGIEQVLGLT